MASTYRSLFGLVICASAAVASFSAKADVFNLTGDVLSATFDFPTSSTQSVYDHFTVNPFTVNGTVETQLVGNASSNNELDVEFNSNSLVLTADDRLSFGAFSFGGPEFSVVSGVPFNPVSQVVTSNGALVSADVSDGVLYVNLEGDIFPVGTQITVDFASDVSATPLPSTWLMLLSGLVGFGFLAYRRPKNSSTAAFAVA